MYHHAVLLSLGKHSLVYNRFPTLHIDCFANSALFVRNQWQCIGHE